MCVPFPLQNKEIESVYSSINKRLTLCLYILWWGQRNPTSTTYTRELLSRSSGKMKFDSSSWYVKAGLLRFFGDHVRVFFLQTTHFAPWLQRTILKIYVVVQCYPWLKFSFLLFQTHYHVIIIHYHTQKQKTRKFEPRINLNHNIYLRRNKPVDIKSSFSLALCASLTRLCHEPSVSIRKKNIIWLKPRVHILLNHEHNRQDQQAKKERHAILMKADPVVNSCKLPVQQLHMLMQKRLDFDNIKDSPWLSLTLNIFCFLWLWQPSISTYLYFIYLPLR